MKPLIKIIAVSLILFAFLVLVAALLLYKNPKIHVSMPSANASKQEEHESGVILDAAAQKRINLVIAETHRTGSSVLIPSSAIIWNEGFAWVYIQKREGYFLREKVNPGRFQDRFPESQLLEVEGIKSGIRVVSQGAQILLSMELSSRFQAEEEE